MLELNKIYCGDCLELMKEIPDKSIDLVLTDPPYNASNFERNFEDKSYMPISEKWDKNFKIDFLEDINRILKDEGSALIFCSYHLLNAYLNDKNLKIKQILHWVKTNPMPSCSNLYTFSVVYILFYSKGKNLWGSTKNGEGGYIFNKIKGHLDIFKYPTEINKFHPTQKPLELIKELLEIHSNKNNLVLDPFLGSGTTAVACKLLDRNFIGIEINPDYVDIANKRLANTYRQMELIK